MSKANRQSFVHARVTARRAVALALLLGVAVAADLARRLVPNASAQGDPVQALSDEYSQLESEGLKENFHRRLSYVMLQEYLPPGTRMTSGYRSPQKQMDLIGRMARAHGIDVPAQMSVEDENSWRPALMGLRAKGFIVAAPTTTPHGTDEAVFDLSGAELGDIEAGLRRAEQAGMVKYKRIIREPRNNAVHVEIESLSPKALNALGRRRGGGASSSGAAPGGGGGGGAAAPASEEDSRRGMLQQLQSLHDSEPDPAKKIDYDRSIRNLLDPAADSQRVAALDAEVKEHQREAQQLGKEGKKREAIADASLALREERYEDAERAASFLVKRYPEMKEARRMLALVRTRRLLKEATAALYSSESPSCDECERAARMIDEASELSPNFEGAQFIREDLDACLQRCKFRRLPLYLLLALVGAAGVAGLYFLARSQNWWQAVAGAAGGAVHGGVAVPKNIFARVAGGARRGWVLQGVEGACLGQVFPLDKNEIVVGSQGPPDGVADVVVLDARRKISRRHCTIMQNGKQFYLVDESTNGTKINGQQVTRGVPAEFRQGDVISLADEAALVLAKGQ